LRTAFIVALASGESQTQDEAGGGSILN
jgi:hypothetical protein